MLEKNLIVRRLGDSIGKKEAPSFDLETVSSTRLSFSSIQPGLEAYRAVRLSEVAGLPPITRHHEFANRVVAAGHPDTCRGRLSISSVRKLAVRLVLRSCNSDTDETLQHVLSRDRVASMPVEEVRKLASECTAIIQFGLTQGWV